MTSMAQESHRSQSVLLIEPDDAIRQSLLEWLRGAMSECCVLGTASLKEAMALPKLEPPPVVVVDIADPELDGAEAIRNIKGTMHCAHVVALTMSDHVEYFDRLACAGASACLLIWNTHCELVAAIKALLATNGKNRKAQ